MRYHPQTILAWGDERAPAAQCGARRARCGCASNAKLGYKQAKYVMRVDAVASLAAVRGGKGGYWEDSTGYDWYAGI